jgi:hypothetical protein
MRRFAAFLAVAVTVAATYAAQDDPPKAAPKELAPRPVVFSKPTLPLQQALAELAAQTGNPVTDLRRQKTNPTLAVPTGAMTFWPALDAIAKASGIAYSTYVNEGGVALTDTPYRVTPAAYSGLFRIALRRTSVSLDEETQTHHLHLAFDIAWEPRFRPFYIDLRQAQLTFAPDADKKQAQDTVRTRSPVPVAGRTAVEIETTAAAPKRSCPAIAALEGKLWAIGPSKMLAFRFGKLAIQKPGSKGPAAPPATQEDVTVTLAAIRRQADALLVTVEIENPKGGPVFDTHQSWLDNNRIVLANGLGARKWTVTAPERDEMRGNRAKLVYAFVESAEQRLPNSLDGWTLTYETPGRIVELMAPFTLKDLALP